MLRAIALDDETPALEILENFANKSPKVNLLAAFTDSNEASSYIVEHPVDLLFVDINMPSISGLEFVNLFTQKELVIFTTAYSEYALNSYDLGGIDYLLKPFDYNRFALAIDKAFIAKSGKIVNLKPISLKVGYSVINIQPENIFVIEGWDNYVKVHMGDGVVYVARITMSSIISLLPNQLFTRVHRSYVINLKKIYSFKGKEIFIGNLRVPIGQKYERGIKDYFRQMNSK